MHGDLPGWKASAKTKCRIEASMHFGPGVQRMPGSLQEWVYIAGEILQTYRVELRQLPMLSFKLISESCSMISVPEGSYLLVGVKLPAPVINQAPVPADGCQSAVSIV